MSEHVGDTLHRPGTLVRQGRFHDALDALAELPAELRDHVDALELAASAAYGAGDLEATLSAWEAIHAAHDRAGEPVAAAHAASMVAMYLMMDTGLMAPVRAWLTRVDRLLADRDETPVHATAAMLRAYERFMCGDMESAGSWGQRAIEVGDRHGVVPAATLGRVVTARVRMFDGHVAEGLEALDEVAVMLMSGQVDPLAAGMVYCELICAMQGLGLHDRAEEWTLAMDAWRTRGEFFGGINGRCRVHRAEMLRLKGSCAEAEDEALHACEELRPWMRREFGWPLTELGTIRLRRGDLAGAEEAFVAAHANGWEPQPGLALLRLAEGSAETAAELLRDALARPVRIPWKERPPIGGISRLPLLEAAAWILVEVGDIDGAASAATELSDLADRYDATALRAAADLAAGLVALARGQPQAALDACRAAAAGWSLVGAPYEAAHARLALAAALRAGGHDSLGVTEDAAARAALDEIGAVPLPLAILGTPSADGAAGAVEAPREGPPGTATQAVFRRDGDTRAITYDRTSVLLRDLKGMRYLARLLAEPEREFHALDLVAVEAGVLPTVGPRTEVGRAELGNDDAGPQLDDQARRAYRRRLAEIEQDIVEAEATGDTERAELARRDRDFIVAELARAFGLGGRARRAVSTSERARTSVTRAIRYALARIAEVHPDLAEHLEATIATGTYCCYRPDPRVRITWET